MITVFFLSHIFNRETQRRYYKLKNQLPAPYKLVILADSKFSSNFMSVSDENILYFDTRTIAKESYAYRLSHSRAKLTPGNIDQLFLWATGFFPESTYFWLIEYDVVFTGNWSHFFKTFKNNKTSFLATSFQKRSDSPDWLWWDYFRNPGRDNQRSSLKTSDDEIRCFTPIMRISSDAASFLKSTYSQSSWSGHMESVLPTALNQSNYTIEDIGGNSFKTPKQRLGNYYTNTLGNNDLSPGTFRYRPSMRVPGREKNKLYHPVKTVEKLHLVFYFIIRIGGFIKLWRL